MQVKISRGLIVCAQHHVPSRAGSNEGQCVDVEWQSGLRTVANGDQWQWSEMKGGLAIWAIVIDVWFPGSASWKISPRKAERFLGKRMRWWCAECGKGIVYLQCVRGWHRYSPRWWDQMSYGKKNRYVWLQSDWRGERLPNPPRLGAQICLPESAILNKHLGSGR